MTHSQNSKLKLYEFDEKLILTITEFWSKKSMALHTSVSSAILTKNVPITLHTYATPSSTFSSFLSLPLFHPSNLPHFLCIFQHGTNFLPFRKLKKLNQSENPRQPLTVTNATTNVQKHTTVRNFLPYGTFLKGDTP